MHAGIVRWSQVLATASGETAKRWKERGTETERHRERGVYRRWKNPTHAYKPKRPPRLEIALNRGRSNHVSKHKRDVEPWRVSLLCPKKRVGSKEEMWDRKKGGDKRQAKSRKSRTSREDDYQNTDTLRTLAKTVGKNVLINKKPSQYAKRKNLCVTVHYAIWQSPAYGKTCKD